MDDEGRDFKKGYNNHKNCRKSDLNIHTFDAI